MSTYYKNPKIQSISVLCICFFFLGCEDKKNEKSNIEPPENLNLPLINVPESAEGVEVSTVVDLAENDFVEKESEFAVTGIIRAISKESYDGQLRVRIMDRRYENSNLVVDDKNPRLKQQSDGQYRYRAELKAPKERGIYEIHIKDRGKIIMKAKLVVK